MTEIGFVIGLALLAGVTSPLAQVDQAALDRLVAAYPDALAGHDAEALRWRDGTAMPLADGDKNRTFAEILRHPSITDQLRLTYPRGPLAKPPAVDADPGRFRNTAFFVKMYGDCKKGEVAPHLVSISWLPTTWGKAVRVTSVNHVDERLRAVSAEIVLLPNKIKRAAYPIAGTYNCRTVRTPGSRARTDTASRSISTLAYSDYWYWRPHTGRIIYRNRVPQEIVAIFEKHGFIWGGKWYHFDTMHFEYRPELLATQ